MSDTDIKLITNMLKNQDKKISNIEKLLENIFNKNNNSLKDTDGFKKAKKKYAGLSGGINLLVDNGFFMQERSSIDVIKELKREGYHYPKTSVRKILGIDFVLKKKILNRIPTKKNQYNFIIRK